MFDGRWRSSFEKRLKPVGVAIRRTGVSADHLTVLGVTMAGAASIAIANGALRAGVLLLALTALPDVLDGAVAKASGTASPRGAFFDSVMDRVSDALLLGGVAWYLSTTEPGRISMLPVAVMAGSLLVSYERAKAEALGFDAKGGLMERAERLLALGFGLLFDSLLIGVLWFMLAATLFTARPTIRQGVAPGQQAGARPTPRAATSPGPSHGAAVGAGPGSARPQASTLTVRSVATRDEQDPDSPGSPRVVTAYRAGIVVGERRSSPCRSTGQPGCRHHGRRSPIVVGGSSSPRNLQRIYGPELTGVALQRKVQQTFESYSRYWMEAFRLPSTSVDELDFGLSYEGYEHLEDALADGLGPLMIIPHLGGWEWAAFWMTEVMDVPVSVVVEKLEPPELYEWFVGLRTAMGMNVIPLGPKAGSEVVKAVNRGEVICLLTDRDIEGTGVEVEFFGETTTMPKGPAMLALRTGAPLLPCAIYYRDGGHHGVVRPAGAGRANRRRAPRRCRPGDPGARPRAGSADPGRARTVAPHVTQLAQRPRSARRGRVVAPATSRTWGPGDARRG